VILILCLDDCEGQAARPITQQVVHELGVVAQRLLAE
jgi:hypothetical protein